MSDLTCPYCKHEYHFDGCYEDLSWSNYIHDECPKCENEFRFQVEFDPVHFGEEQIDKPKDQK